ncbi:hypothetical protein ACFFX0_01105 [Citricoccus parietis]|uniref:Uncharacterized protein n=1 Tax=Citricoccus parietis TaxID=592307 RepID=A0ABV5FUC6_9MICC
MARGRRRPPGRSPGRSAVRIRPPLPTPRIETADPSQRGRHP